MWKALVCLFLGHMPFKKIKTVVHPPRALGTIEMNGAHTGDIITQALRVAQGFTSVSLMCPRCNKIKVIEQ